MQEFADALMEVKCAIVEIKTSKTLKLALGSLLSIGNFLNGKQVCLVNLKIAGSIYTV